MSRMASNDMRDLVKAVDGPEDAEATQAWEREILRWLAEVDEGTAKPIDCVELSRRTHI